MPSRAQPVDQRPQLLAHLRVEPDGRLVEQDQPRLVHEPARDQQPPAHAARELVDLRVAAVGQVGDRRARARPPPPLRARHAVEVREHEQVLLDGQLDVEVVELRDDAHLARAPAWSRAGSSWPSTSSSPSSAIACAVSSFIVVDLPAPLGPSSPKQVPSGTSRSSPSTAVIGAVALDGAAQADREGGQAADASGRPTALRGELHGAAHADLVAPAVLGLVQREVGLGEDRLVVELAGRRGARRRRTSSRAGRRPAASRSRARRSSATSAACVGVGAGDDDEELLAAEAVGEVVGAQPLADPVGDVACSDGVAGGVAVAVVDRT